MKEFALRKDKRIEERKLALLNQIVQLKANLDTIGRQDLSKQQLLSRMVTNRNFRQV